MEVNSITDTGGTASVMVDNIKECFHDNLVTRWSHGGHLCHTGTYGSGNVMVDNKYKISMKTWLLGGLMEVTSAKNTGFQCL